MRTLMIAATAMLFLPFLTESASAGSLVARVDISDQSMTVSENGIVLHRWRVSTGAGRYVTPTGNYGAKWASKNHRSRKYNNAPMPYAIFFKGGYAVHGTYDVKRLGRPASHGCVRLHPDNASRFFTMAQRHGLKNTRIVITR